MTQKQIQRQIEVIELVGAELIKSKEASRQFLIDAGITLIDTGTIKEKRKRKTPAKKK